MTFSHPRRLTSPRRLQRAPGSNRILVYPVLLALIIAAGWYYRGHRPQPHMVAKPPIPVAISSPSPSPAAPTSPPVTLPPPPSATPTPTPSATPTPPPTPTPTPTPSAPQLSEYKLTGARKVKCLQLVIAVDVSGSMDNFATPRDDALNQLFTWLAVGHNLKDQDKVAIIDFAGVAKTRMPSTAVADLGTLPGPTDAATATGFGLGFLFNNGTNFDPVLDQVSAFPPMPGCETALVLISDAQLEDLPGSAADGQALLHSKGVDEIRLLVPGSGIAVGSGWQPAFPSATPNVFDGTDSQATGLAFGHTIADLTGQKLKLK